MVVIGADTGGALLVPVPLVAVKGRRGLAPVLAGLPRHFAKQPPHVLAHKSAVRLVVRRRRACGGIFSGPGRRARSTL